MSKQYWELSLSEASALLAVGDLSPVELVDSALQRIEETQPTLNTFALVTADRAREQAGVAEREIRSGNYRGPLHGIPLAVKDVFDVEGLPTRAGSKATSDAPAKRTGTMITRLEDAGMVMLGKTNGHELSLGGITPQVRNPWNTAHVPGGSSGGSAAAIASGQCLVAAGGDTGGSLRIPAAACGVVGLKPTEGLVPRSGAVPLSWSLDTVGALTRDIIDSALVLNAIAGYDASDYGSLRAPVKDYADGLDRGVEGLRVGVVPLSSILPAEPEVLQAFQVAVAQFEAAGADVREVELPFDDAMLAVHRAIVLPEAAAVHRELLQERGELVGNDVRQVLEAAQFVFASDYIRAQRLRSTILSSWHGLFRDIDVLVGPTLPAPPPKTGQQEYDWGAEGLEPVRNSVIRLSVPANVTGFPALAIPIGWSASGLPLSMQLVGRPFEEDVLLRTGAAYERAMGTTRRIAAVS